MPRAVISGRRDVGGGLLQISLDVDEATARTYTAPGQYIQVLTATDSGYFVLAGDVGARPWELLVRNAGSAADLLASRAIGAAVQVSDPLGAGFPQAVAHPGPLVVAVVASALGVARALVDARIDRDAADSTYVYVGVRAAADVPLAEQVASWSERGAHVVLCLSREELVHHREMLPRAERAEGYVQVAIRRALAASRFASGDALVVAAGPPGMLEDLRGVVATAAAHGERVGLLTNVG